MPKCMSLIFTVKLFYTLKHTFLRHTLFGEETWSRAMRTALIPTSACTCCLTSPGGTACGRRWRRGTSTPRSMRSKTASDHIPFECGPSHHLYLMFIFLFFLYSCLLFSPSSSFSSSLTCSIFSTPSYLLCSVFSSFLLLLLFPLLSILLSSLLFMLNYWFIVIMMLNN